MEPAQYTGKTDATQGGPAAGESPSSAPGTSPTPAARSGTTVRGPTIRPGSNFVRLVGWGAVLAVLAAGLVLYFRYERAIVPLFGRGR